MKSDELRIAEAVAALRARLDSWGVDDAAERATAYINDMLRNGWRPRARAVEAPEPTTPCDPETARQRIAEIRRQIRPLDSTERDDR